MENEEGLEKLSERIAAQTKRLAAELEEKINPLRDRIRILAAQRRGIEKGRISKAEAVQKMKEDLEKGRKEYFMEFVRVNLSAYQQGGGQFRPLQNLDHIRTHQMADSSGYLKFLFSWITGEMVDEVSQFLEEGPTEKERKTKIEAINREIEKAEKEMEALLK